ncbi:hypothetical protein V8E52_007404 [Russula decolorans]
MCKSLFLGLMFLHQLTRATLYALRFLISLLTMETPIHVMHVVAIKDACGPWSYPFLVFGTSHSSGSRPNRCFCCGNFLVYGHLCAVLDPLENMVRCMANKYSPLGSWRSLHRSFDLWIVCYYCTSTFRSAGRIDSPRRVC